MAANRERLNQLLAERERRRRQQTAIPEGAERDALERQQLIESAPDTPDMSTILGTMLGGGERTAADVTDPRVTDLGPDFSFLDVALPVGGGTLGAIGGSVLGPAGTAGGAALGSAGGTMLADLLAGDEVDLGDAAISALLGGAAPGAGRAVGAGAMGAGRLAREFAPDLAGGILGGSIGHSTLPGFGALGGFFLGSRGAAGIMGRTGTTRQRAAKAIRGRRRGSEPQPAVNRSPDAIQRNAEREARLRRELMGIDQ